VEHQEFHQITAFVSLGENLLKLEKKPTDPAYYWLKEIMMKAIAEEPGIKSGLCPPFTFSSVDLVAWKDPKEEPGIRYWMIEITMKEGHPHRYVMNYRQVADTPDHKGSILSLKQITRYFMYQSCTPQGASPEFCIC